MDRLPCQKIGRRQKFLLPEQATYLREFAQERRKAHLSCTRINEQEAEAHLREAYHVAELPPPSIHWFDSPLAFVRAHYDPSTNDDMRSNVLFQAREMGIEFRDWQRTRASLYLDIRKCMLESLQLTMVRNLCNILCQSVQENIWPNGSSPMEEDISTATWKYCRLETPSWYLLENEICMSVWSLARLEEIALRWFYHELYEESDFIHLAHFSELVSGYRLGSSEAWVVRKPIRYCFDDRERLHNENGPCVEYRDGWKLYAWHGVRVPEEVILYPEYLTRDDWLQAANVEVRRVIQERMPDFVEQVGARFIDGDTRGCLYAVDLPNDPEGVAHYVQVSDSSTNRIYYLRVPPSIRRANEAVAWTFGLGEQDYQPEQET